MVIEPIQRSATMSEIGKIFDLTARTPKAKKLRRGRYREHVEMLNDEYLSHNSTDFNKRLFALVVFVLVWVMYPNPLWLFLFASVAVWKLSRFIVRDTIADVAHNVYGISPMTMKAIKACLPPEYYNKLVDNLNAEFEKLLSDNSTSTELAKKMAVDQVLEKINNEFVRHQYGRQIVQIVFEKE